MTRAAFGLFAISGRLRSLCLRRICGYISRLFIKGIPCGRAMGGRMTDATEDSADAVVVGSGFGGSVVACRLAEAQRSVCLLERGKRYPPGSFPRRPADMARNFWDPGAGLQGLFDIWSFRHVESVVASG